MFLSQELEVRTPMQTTGDRIGFWNFFWNDKEVWSPRSDTEESRSRRESGGSTSEAGGRNRNSANEERERVRERMHTDERFTERRQKTQQLNSIQFVLYSPLSQIHDIPVPGPHIGSGKQ